MTTPTGFSVTDYTSCERKGKCACETNNPGHVYNLAEPCLEGYTFDEANCDCLIPKCYVYVGEAMTSAVPCGGSGSGSITTFGPNTWETASGLPDPIGPTTGHSSVAYQGDTCAASSAPEGAIVNFTLIKDCNGNTLNSAAQIDCRGGTSVAGRQTVGVYVWQVEFDQGLLYNTAVLVLKDTRPGGFTIPASNNPFGWPDDF